MIDCQQPTRGTIIDALENKRNFLVAKTCNRFRIINTKPHKCVNARHGTVTALLLILKVFMCFVLFNLKTIADFSSRNVASLSKASIVGLRSETFPLQVPILMVYTCYLHFFLVLQYRKTARYELDKIVSGRDRVLKIRTLYIVPRSGQREVGNRLLDFQLHPTCEKFVYTRDHQNSQFFIRIFQTG